MAILSLNEILQNDVLAALAGADAVLSKVVMNLTSQVQPGSDRVTIPSITGLAVADITSGSRAGADSVTTTGSVLLLDKIKQVHQYISYKDGVQSAVDQRANFLKEAPKYMVESIEESIAAKLATASSLDFDSASATAGQFAIADISKAKKLFDQQKVPKNDRYMVVNAEAMEILANMTEFQDGQKSLSPEALREGVVSQVKGFKVLQSEEVGGSGAANKIHFFHKSAVAWALQDGMTYIDKEIEEYGQAFLALRAMFGCIDTENASNTSKRKLTMSLTTATS